MARIRAVASTAVPAGVSEATYTSASAGYYKTILSVAPTDQHIIAIKGFSVAFDGINVAAAPVLVKVYQGSTQGTATSVTLYEETLHGVTLSSHATAYRQHSAEPASETKIYRIYNVHPQTGIEVRYNPDDELLQKGSANAFCIAINAEAPVNATAAIWFEA